MFGNKNEVYESTLPVTNQYPELSTEEFQEVFHFLSSETEASLLHHLILARLTVHTELSNILMPYETLDRVSEYWVWRDGIEALALYKQAVFSLAANHIVGNKLGEHGRHCRGGRQTRGSATKGGQLLGAISSRSG